MAERLSVPNRKVFRPGESEDLHKYIEKVWRRKDMYVMVHRVQDSTNRVKFRAETLTDHMDAPSYHDNFVGVFNGHVSREVIEECMTA